MGPTRPLPEAASGIPRPWLEVFFVYIGAMTLLNGLIAIHALRNWILSDWLINYEGGFVRRGLTGQIALFLSHLFHLSPVFFVVTCYLLLYAIFILAFRSLVLKSDRDFWILALVFSPAVLSFQVLHRGAGYRKEIIYLAALSLFLGLLRKNKVSALYGSVLLTLYIVASTLSHEGLIFYAPYFFAALLLSGKTLKLAARECAVPCVAGVVVSMACFYHHGDQETASQVCSSVGYKLLAIPGSTEICASGAIPYLAKTPAVAGQEALAKIVHYQYLWVFPAYALLAVVPAVGESVVLRRSGMRREVFIVWMTAAASFVGTLILFRYAVDWGRWIYIHIASIALLLIFINGSHAGTSAGPAEARLDLSRGRRWAYSLILFLYATCWILPSDTETLRMGYAGRVLEVLHITAKATHAERIPSD